MAKRRAVEALVDREEMLAVFGCGRGLELGVQRAQLGDLGLGGALGHHAGGIALEQ